MEQVAKKKKHLKAGESAGRSPSAVLKQLRLEPIVPDVAPLLMIYQENASATQIGASLIIQRRFRELRYYRYTQEKARFYLPRNTLELPPSRRPIRESHSGGVSARSPPLGSSRSPPPDSSRSRRGR